MGGCYARNAPTLLTPWPNRVCPCSLHSGPAFHRRRLSRRLHQATESSASRASFPPVSLGRDEPPLRIDLRTLMKLFKVPAVSVAVIDDYKIAWAKGYGVTEASGAMPVTTRTLFQAGSISKPVAAAAALYLVKNGKLSLDEDVNQKLKSWKVPENELTKQQKVTLRLMTHTAGVNVHSFFGYDLDDPIPTLLQVLRLTRHSASYRLLI